MGTSPRPDGTRDILPIDAVPISGVSAAVITTTTLSVVIPAASVAATKALFITDVWCANEHATEPGTTAWQSSNGTPVVHGVLGTGPGATGGGSAHQHYDPPIQVALGEGIAGISKVAVIGDVWMTAVGYVGTPKS